MSSSNTKLLPILLVLVTASVLWTGCSSSTSDSGAEEDTIKVVKVPTEEMIRKKNKVKTCFEKTDTDESCIRTTCNKEGFVTEYRWYDNCEDKKESSKKTYRYDAVGKLLETDNYYEGKLSSKWTNTYKDSLLISTITYDVEEKKVRKEKRCFYTPEGKLDYELEGDFKTTCHYDSHGLLENSWFRDMAAEKLDESVEYYTYNKSGWKIKTESIDDGGLGRQNTYYEYSAEGRLTKQYSVHEQFGIRHTWTFEYNQGGLLTKTIHEKKVSGLAVEHGQTDERNVTEYAYTYFE